LKYIAINGKTALELLEEEKKLLLAFLSGISCYMIKSEKRAWFNMISKSTEKKT